MLLGLGNLIFPVSVNLSLLYWATVQCDVLYLWDHFGWVKVPDSFFFGWVLVLCCIGELPVSEMQGRAPLQATTQDLVEEGQHGEPLSPS